MNLLNSFNDFYDNLSSNGLFFFWIIVFLFVFLIFLLIVLYFKNKKLIKLLKDNRDTTINTISEEAPIENKEVPISNATFTVEDKILENDTTSLTDVKEVIKDGMGKVSIYFCPAEEFTDIAYRQSLIKDGKIRYIGGKVNMLTEGIFDDVDLCIHLHAMGNDYQYGINSRLAGFIYKKYTFIGKASHAAVLPHLGVNALNAFALFQSAQGMLRETFKDEDKNRVHGRLISGGETVNSIPEIVEYESYIRSFNSDTLTHCVPS